MKKFVLYILICCAAMGASLRAQSKQMAADADPSLEVATIKPDETGAIQMQQLAMRGQNFRTRASSVEDLIGFAYDVQAKQIVGGPDWMSKDRYDIEGVPDIEGAPSSQQLRSMIRKLLADRFQLTFHKDSRQLSAFVLTVGKDGAKLPPTQLNWPGPSIGMKQATGGLTVVVQNGTMQDFAGFLQGFVLDRPVVDRTERREKFDFTLTFLPDESQFNGRSPLGTLADGVEPAPALVEALQAQLGLKLSVEKISVGVIAVDGVQKPAAN